MSIYDPVSAHMSTIVLLICFIICRPTIRGLAEHFSQCMKQTVAQSLTSNMTANKRPDRRSECARYRGQWRQQTYLGTPGHFSTCVETRSRILFETASQRTISEVLWGILNSSGAQEWGWNMHI